MIRQEAAAQTAWLNWYPSLGQIILFLLAFMAVGIGISLGLEYFFPSAETGDVSGPFMTGSLFLVLGIMGLFLQGTRTQGAARFLAVLLLAMVYAGLLSGYILLVLSEGNGLDDMRIQSLLLAGGAIALVCMLCFTPQVRAWLAAFIPMDPGNFVHAYAVAAGIALTGIACLNLIPFREPLLYAVLDDITLDLENLDSTWRMNATMVSTILWCIPAVLLAVGLGQSRSLGQALQRLGLQRPTRKSWSIGASAGLLAVGLGLGLGFLVETIWTRFNLPTTDFEQFSQLAGLPVHLSGMLLLALSAGITEELLVRGVLQPRLGILLSNAMFAAAHAFQYTTDGLTVVLLLGFAFGFLRLRYGLLPAIVAHALYDLLLLMLSTFTEFV